MQSFEGLRNIEGAVDDADWLLCSHEYTATNAKFTLSLGPPSPALSARVEEVRTLREGGLPTVPVGMSVERETNAFLRAGTVEEFEVVRRKKDEF